MDDGQRQANEETRDSWNSNADYWDKRMGEGNDFVELLLWPVVERLLPVRKGMRILDVACGNGLTSRRLAAQGAEVVAFDFSAEMIGHARHRTAQMAVGGREGQEAADRISYRICDATDHEALLALGQPGTFHGALSNMALFDIADVTPLFDALALLLRPGSSFVFSLMHPCFNNPFTRQYAEMVDDEGEVKTIYGVKVEGYLTPAAARGAALAGQPKAHVYFHRPLQLLLGAAFRAGFVVDAFEERTFPPGHPAGSTPLGWSGHFGEIPPALIVRARLLGAA